MKEKVEKVIKNHLADEQSKRKGKHVPSHIKCDDPMKLGFFFGRKKGSHVPVVKPHSLDGHILVVGAPKSGKTSCIAIPTLATWRYPIFAISIKGDLCDGWKFWPYNARRHVKFFSFSKDSDWKYDPFYLLREGDPDDLERNARELAQSIIPIPVDIKDPFWKQGAQNVLTATILYVYGMREPDEESGKVLQGTFNEAMTLIVSEPIWELVEEIDKSDNEEAKLCISQFRGIENPQESKMLQGIQAELKESVMTYATDNRIKTAFTPSENLIRWEDLENTSIFLQIPEDKLGQWDGAIKLMVTQLIRTLERRPDKHSDEQKKKKLPPVLLLLDEFPRLGKMDVIMNAVNTLRSKGVTICLMMQSIAQLDRIYGRNARKEIVNACDYKAILSAYDPEDQKYFSDMVGDLITTRSGVSESLEVDEKGEHTITFSKTQVREPIIFPSEFGTLGDEFVLLMPEGFCRIKKVPYYKW